jgi:hypothetical protein
MWPSVAPNGPRGPPPSPEDFAARLLEDLDTGTDGALSADEIGAAEDTRLQEMLKAADADGDGFLTESEIISDGEKKAKVFRDRSTYPSPGWTGAPTLTSPACSNPPAAAFSRISPTACGRTSSRATAV